jgi:small subunit ribosomal protein S9
MATKAAPYIEAIGRRKTSTARARITPASKESISVNDKTLQEYFQTEFMAAVARAALNSLTTSKFSVTVHVKGGGLKSQSEAVRHATARALLIFDKDLRKDLKAKGFLTRDPRMVERKKFGLKKARRAPQWSKR